MSSLRRCRNVDLRDPSQIEIGHRLVPHQWGRARQIALQSCGKIPPLV